MGRTPASYKRNQIASKLRLGHNTRRMPSQTLRTRLVRVTQIVPPIMLLLWPVFVSAQSASSNYSVNETFFGTGGELDASSTNFRAKQSAGETTVGNTTSTNFQAQGGFNTTDQPFLEFSVTGSNTDLGVLSTGNTGHTTGVFAIRTYLASGYIIQTASDPPKNSNYFLSPLATPTASSAGTEQFGINLVHNTSPTSFGSDPVQIPDSSFGFGTVASGYNTTNLYKYVKYDTVASSNQSSGTTQYTVSYIYNISTTTAGGTFSFNHVLVATSTY